MKKKLLLSFAVFATVLSVNAQKRVASTRVHKEYKVAYSTDVDNDNSTDFSIGSLSGKVQTKRGVQNLTDTSQFFGYKASYASPKTSGSYVAPMFFKDSVDLATVFQIIPNKTPIILKGIMTSIVSVNPKGSDVQVKIYDMKTGVTLAKAQKTVAYSATALSMVGFDFDKPYSTSGDILISIEPANVKDSFYVSNSGAYKNSSITCSITGNQLTVVSPAPTSPANVGTGFWTGQEITGAGIPAGTKITGYNSTSKAYTISSTVSSPITSVIVSGVNLAFTALANNSGFMYLKFPATNGVIDFTKAPKEAADALIWEKGTDGKWSPKDANLTIYPIVQYDFESTPIIDNNCLGNNKSVNLTYSNTNAFSIAKNPLLNKMAFWTQYLGYNKKSGYFHSRAYTSSKSYLDTLDNNASAFKYLYTATSDASNDTLRVLDILLPYGFKKNPGTKGFLNTFLLSSKLVDVTTITPLSPKCYYDKASDAISVKGFAPYTGLPNVGDIAGAYKVTDANGCFVNITLTAPITAAPTKFTWTSAAKVDAAKCFGDKAKVTVTITGGTGTYTGLTQEFATTAAVQTKNIVVADPNGCRDTVKNVSIPVGPTKVVATATVTNVKCFGDSASVEVKATGGTGVFTGVGIKKFTATAASTQKIEVSDANKCLATVDAAITAAPAKIVATTIVTEAKCNGEKVKVEVKANGGTGVLTGTGLFYEDAVVATKSYNVVDSFKCTVKVDASIKAVSGNAAAPVVTATVADAKCFGDSAKVTVTATGSGTLTGIGVKTFAAVVASKTLEVKNEAGCVGIAVAQIKAAPSKVIATATVVNAKCFGDSAKVTITAAGGTGAFTGTGIKSIANPKASTVKYAVMDASACKSDSVSAAIKAAPVKLEVTTAATTATSPTAVDGKATATPTGGTAPYTYAWDNKDKSTTAEIKVVKGTYNVVVKDANNCTVNGSIKVSSLSVESLSISGLSIYPNPVANELNVKFNAISAATIELVNVAGQVIASKDASEFANVTFDTATLNAGVYFVNIKVAEGVFTQKIIKE